MDISRTAIDIRNRVPAFGQSGHHPLTFKIENHVCKSNYRLRNAGRCSPRPDATIAHAFAAAQAARYVSLAYALSPPPSLDAPDRSDDLPAGVLDVLDFAPLVREFYRKSGIDERLPSYLRAYQTEGDRLWLPAGEMVRA